MSFPKQCACALDRADVATLPIVALTANAFLEDIEKAHDAGMNGHMAKPVDPEKLAKVMDEYLGS